MTWLIRHGESEANIGVSTPDPASVRLTPQGYKQAKCVAEYFIAPPSLIVTSPYLRTKQTAQATIERFPDVPQQEWAVQEITYLSPAKYRNTSFSDRKPAADRFWQIADPHYQDGDDAESFADYIGRIGCFVRQLEAAESSIAVFTHETVIQTVLWLALNQSLEINSANMRSFRQFTASFRFPNCAILAVEFRHNHLWFSHITSHLSSLVIF
jgi:2,3-bisphosphoglycerate-dependent phosphoglycerate mutase